MRCLKFFSAFICSLVCVFLVSTLYSGRLLALERYELECDSALWYQSLEIAIAQEGTTETGNNSGAVKKYWSWLFSYPVPYCYAGQYWSFLEACKRLDYSADSIPILKTGLVSAAWNAARKAGVKIRADPERGDLIAWRLSRSNSGHVGRVKRKLAPGVVETIEFNTSSGEVGSQRDGGGVYSRKRAYLHPLGRMNCLGFIGRAS